MSVTHVSKPVQDVTIVAADSPRLVKEFVELPYRMYANDPHWVPELRSDARKRLDKRRNPFLAHADMALYLARRGGRTVGRIAAIEDHAHNEFHHEKIAWFGFFEAQDAATARALLETAETWGRARGCTLVRGPANPSLNESAGLLIDGFDDDPYVLMPYNPPIYASYVEGAGYKKVKDLWAWDFDTAAPVGARVAKIAERVRKRHGITVRNVNMKDYDAELKRMVAVYSKAWEDNWGFVPPTDAEMKQLATDLKPIVDPDLVHFAEIGGRTIAVTVVLPDVNQVLKKMGGSLFPFGLFHFLNRRKIINRCRLLLLGVLPEYRNIGLYPLMIAEIYKAAYDNGYKRGDASWTLEDNDAVNAGIEAAGGRKYKTYRMYDKPLG